MARPSTLTTKVAESLEFYWQLVGDKLSDEDICTKVGVSWGQLHGWLERNTKPKGPDGKHGPEGLRSIRERAKVSVMTGYLTELHKNMRDAQAAGDHRAVSTILFWLLEKQFPTKFGNRIKVEMDESKTGVVEVPPVSPPGEWPPRPGADPVPTTSPEGS